jgi:hypothetical protein
VDLGLNVVMTTPEYAARFPLRPPTVSPHGNPALTTQTEFGMLTGLPPQAITVVERAPILQTVDLAHRNRR